MHKVYVVDDASLVRKEITLTTPWTELGCVVVGEAGDGETALEEILFLQPEIVITDIRMPRLDGLELIRSIKSRGLDTEFIVISAYSEFEYAITAIKLEVQDYILKPIDDNELIATIKKVIDRVEYRQGYRLNPENVQDNDLDRLLNQVESCSNSYIINAVKFIKKEFQQEISYKSLSGELGISESYLVRLFKVETNCTFVEYLTALRIKKSLKLLRSNNKIYEVSQMVGYKDYRYFSAIFKKLLGVSPKEYQLNSVINPTLVRKNYSGYSFTE